MEKRACSRGKSTGYYEELKLDVLEDEEEEVKLNDPEVFEVERVVHKRKRKVISFLMYFKVLLILLSEQNGVLGVVEGV